MTSFRFNVVAIAWIGCLPASAVATSFSDPRDLVGNVLWLDGSDVDGDFVAGGAFLDGTTWVDKSTANTADAIQADSSQRPTVVSAGLNDRTVVRLDGIDDIMDIDSNAFGMLADVAGATLFGVVSTDQAPSSRGQRVLMVSTGASSSETSAGLNLFDNFGTSVAGTGDFGLAGRRVDTDPFQRIEGGAIAANEFNQFAGVFEYATGSLSLYANGALETFADNFQSAGNTSSTDSLNIRIGADASTSSLRGLFSGDIAELIVYDRALNEVERQMVEEYLNAKWFTAPLVGDYNADGVVEAADYTVWRDSLDETGLGLPADGNGDGQVDGDDYEIWRARYGMTLSDVASTTIALPVPEPTAFALLFASIPLVHLKRQERLKMDPLRPT